MVDNLPTIAVIMSAYNAEKYILEQISSILNQRNVNVRLWIRNDGSKDNTLKIIRDGFGNDQRVVVTSGSNLGAAESFFQAIFDCNFDCDFYGFSDADDVWIEDKLAISVDSIKFRSLSIPMAVATQMKVVDENLKIIGLTKPPRIGLKFNNAVVQTVASGASLLMNKSAFRLLRSYKPKNIVMHDAWVYLLITAFGEFLFIEQPTILYRQHGQNVFGTSHGFRKRVENRLKRIKYRSPYRGQAAEFLSVFGDQLESESRGIIERYVNYDKTFVSRLWFAIWPSVQMQNWKSDIFQRFLVLLGKA